MAVLKFLSVAAAAVFFSAISWAHGDPDPNAITPEVERVECWKQMNAARSLVGFVDLKQKDMLKTSAEEWEGDDDGTALKAYLAAVCAAVKKEQSQTAKGVAATMGATFAYAVQDGDDVDCAAAVDYWKAAFTNFNGTLPPVYTENTTPYDSLQNISFISLFNPKDSPNVDCAYFTCPAAATESRGQEQGTSTEKGVNALICVTTPSALEAEKQPYEQEQWDKITAGLNPSSAGAAAPTAIALAAAAVAVLFL
ncbi:SAG family member [Eimeria brunetti]|uniref:SAG family member n=1 Tax=Eimeria brunetti TaxID=51314 RepID=U6LMM9_9EIME|nr:SAG family member [Eimeria brunetti]